MSETQRESIREPTRRGSQVKGKRRHRSVYRSLKARERRAKRTGREGEKKE